jgi:hypothetical protein
MIDEFQMNNHYTEAQQPTSNCNFSPDIYPDEKGDQLDESRAENFFVFVLPTRRNMSISFTAYFWYPRYFCDTMQFEYAMRSRGPKSYRLVNGA